MKNRDFISIASVAAVLLSLAVPIGASIAWTGLGPAVPATDGPVAAEPAPGRIYIGTPSGRILMSTDGGATWAPAADGLADLDLSGLTLDPRDPSFPHAAGLYGVHETGSGAE